MLSKEEIQSRIEKAREEGKLKFAHLHGHTIFSKLDALTKPDALMKKAKDSGMDIVAVTEHGRMNGWYQLTKSAEKYGVKVILGCEVYLTKDRTLKNPKQIKELRQGTDVAYANTHMVLLPHTQEGLKNLQHIVSDGSINGGMTVYGQWFARTDIDVIKENGWGKGLIASTSCITSRVSKYIHEGRRDLAEQHIDEIREIFDDLYLEVQINDVKDEFVDQELVNKFIVEYAEEVGLPIVLTQDYHYLEEQDRKPHNLWKVIGNPIDAKKAKAGKKDINLDNDNGFGGRPVHFATPEEMYEKVITHPFIPEDAFHNTYKIAEKCVENIPEGKSSLLELGRDLYPKFRDLEEGETVDEHLQKKVFEGLERRYEQFGNEGKPYDKQEYIDRANYELGIISQMGYSDYFLVLKDIFDFCEQEDILTGPGRGSAVGSLVSYAIRITHVDPIEYGLLFERFLNPERVSPPDIDSDFHTKKREQVFHYIGRKYGYDSAAHVANYSYMKLRGAIRDICRALKSEGHEEYTPQLADKVAKLVPAKMPDGSDPTFYKLMHICMEPEEFEEDLGEDLDKMVKVSRDFRDYMDMHPELCYYLEHIGGAIRSYGIHAAAVVISPEGPLADWVPLQQETDSVLPVTQFNKDEVEELGLLKLDLLGLKNLDVIDEASRLVKETEEHEIKMYEIGREDQKVFELLRTANTHGIFQLAGGGATQLAKRVNPTTFQEWIDIIALYRPGPLNGEVVEGSGVTIVEQYVKNGNTRTLENYVHEIPDALKPIFKETRGVLIYQEQIQQLAQKMAGYTVGGGDVLRRAVSKKYKSVLGCVRYEFVFGTEIALEEIPKYIKENWDAWTPKEQSEAEKFFKGVKKKEKEFYVKGAVNNGFTEQYAETIYKQIVAFAAYGFNKSHSAAYADIGYQTGYLKAYYPHEFVAASLTTDSSDNDKIKKHLSEAKKMGVRVLHPDINHSQRHHSIVKGEDGEKVVRYGIAGMSYVGDAKVDMIMKERNENGHFQSLDDFLDRMKGSGLDLRAIQNLIKAGAFVSIEGEDRSKTLNRYLFDIYYKSAAKKKREQLDEEGKYNEPMNDRDLMKYEEEVIGLSITFNPLEDLPKRAWETIADGEKLVLGALVQGMREHTDRNGNTMAFVTLELYSGTVEMPIFASNYDQYKNHIQEGNILVVRGKKKIEKGGKYDGKESIMVSSIIYGENYKGDEEPEPQVELDLEQKPNYVADIMPDYDDEPPAPPHVEPEPEPVATATSNAPTIEIPKFNPMWDFFR